MGSAVRGRIEALHGEKMLARSALRSGAEIFERVLAGKGYRTVLEIGTYRGCSAAEMANYCDRVITIDLKRGQLEQNGVNFDRRAFWDSLGIGNIDLHLVGDDADKTILVNSLEFDFAFIDGAHDQSVSVDFDLVRRCGRVLFHDYNEDDAGLHYVRDVVKSLPKEQVQIFGVFALWTV